MMEMFMPALADSAGGILGALGYKAEQQQLAMQLQDQQDKKMTMYLIVGIVLVSLVALAAIFFMKK